MDVIADQKAGAIGGDDLAYGAGLHHFADADGRDVGATLVHPAAHRRVERDVKNLDQEFAVARLGAGSSVRFQSLGLGTPVGRAASRN